MTGCTRSRWKEHPISPKVSLLARENGATYDPQFSSYRTADVSDVPSDSPPGFTHTIASSDGAGVFVVGRGPNPAALLLHQSPPLRSTSWLPERPWSYQFQVSFYTRGRVVDVSAYGDEVRREALGLEQRREGLVVHQLVVPLLVLGAEPVVVAHVRAHAADARLGVARFGVPKNLPEELRSWPDILRDSGVRMRIMVKR